MHIFQKYLSRILFDFKNSKSDKLSFADFSKLTVGELNVWSIEQELKPVIFDIKNIYPEKLGEMVAKNAPATITFDGGDVHEGWIHETYRQYSDGKDTFETWESGGYQQDIDQEEMEINNTILEELKERFIREERPLPRWTNKKGWDLWLSCITPDAQIERLGKENERLQDQIRRRNKQIRDLRKSLTAKK